MTIIIYFILLLLFILFIYKLCDFTEYFDNTDTGIQNLFTNINPVITTKNINTSTNKIIIDFPKFYPITTNFDPIFYNYNNLLSNTSISIINEILINTINKVNENSYIIYFNPNLKQVSSLLLLDDNVIDFAKYLISIMNSVSIIGNSFTFNKVIPVSKEQYENQVRINFHLEIIYNYPKSKNKQYDITPSDFPLTLNIVVLFEKIYQNEDLFFKTNQKNTTNIYLETLTLMDIINSGYLPGNYTKTK